MGTEDRAPEFGCRDAVEAPLALTHGRPNAYVSPGSVELQTGLLDDFGSLGDFDCLKAPELFERHGRTFQANLCKPRRQCGTFYHLHNLVVQPLEEVAPQI